MAIGMFKLTKRQREQLSTVFLALNIIQILFGFGMTTSSIYIVIAISPILQSEKAEINFAFTVTGICGTHVIFHWIIGIKMCRKSLKQAHKKSTNSLLLLWYCAGTNTVVILIIISHLARKNSKHMAKSMKNSISTGMSQYLKDGTWKETIDKLQYENECCGITSHENWHGIEWMNKYHVDVNSESVKQFRTSQDNLNLPVTPWSCCRIDFPMQCLHDPLQQAQFAHIWVDEPTIVTDSINTKGCFEGLKRPIISVTNLFIFFTSVVFILHIAIIIVSRILYTSSRNAVLLNDPEGIAPGWIFGRGDCGYSGGKTLGEIMGISATIIEENEKRTKKKNLGRIVPKRFKRKKEESVPLLENLTQNGHINNENDEPPVMEAAGSVAVPENTNLDMMVEPENIEAIPSEKIGEKQLVNNDNLRAK